MTETVGRYAQFKAGSNEVENVIVMSATFTMEGYTFSALSEGQSCQPGAYYNSKDGNYYLEGEFKTRVSEQKAPDVTVTKTAS